MIYLQLSTVYFLLPLIHRLMVSRKSATACFTHSYFLTNCFACRHNVEYVTVKGYEVYRVNQGFVKHCNIYPYLSPGAAWACPSECIISLMTD